MTLTERYLEPAMAVQNLLQACSLGTLKSVDVLAVGTGPGLFTGLRTALSFVQGLARSLCRPCFAVSSFAALAQDAFEHRPEAEFAVVVAGMRADAVCLGIWQRDVGCVLEPQIRQGRLPVPDEMAVLVPAPGMSPGTLPDALQSMECHSCAHPSLAVLRLALRRFCADQAGDSPENIVAHYLPGADWKTLAEQRKPSS